MTFLAIVIDLAKKLDQKLADITTYQNLQYLDDRLLQDIGLQRENGRIVEMSGLVEPVSELTLGPVRHVNLYQEEATSDDILTVNSSMLQDTGG